MRSDDDTAVGLDIAWEDEPTRLVPQQRRRKRGGGGRSYLALVLSVLLLGALGGGVYWGVGMLQDQFGPKDYEAGQQGAEVQVTIPEGASGSVMAQALVKAGVVKTAEAFVTAYEANKVERLGPEAARPHRVTHRRLTRD